MSTEHFDRPEHHAEDGFEIHRGDDVAPMFDESMSSGIEQEPVAVEPVVVKKKKKAGVSPQMMRMLGIAAAVAVAVVGYTVWNKMHHARPAAAPMLTQKMTPPPGDVVNGQPVQVTATATTPVGPAPTPLDPMMQPLTPLPEKTVITAPGATVTTVAAEATATSPAVTTTTITPPQQAVVVAAPAPVAVAAPVVVAPNDGLNAEQAATLNRRVASLESKLATLQARSTQSAETRSVVLHARPAAEDGPKHKHVAKRAVRKVEDEPAVVASTRPPTSIVLAQPVVRVIGATSRNGVVAVLVDVAGAKKSVIPGDQIAGLGRVDATGVDGDSGYVSVNGATFR